MRHPIHSHGGRVNTPYGLSDIGGGGGGSSSTEFAAGSMEAAVERDRSMRIVHYTMGALYIVGFLATGILMHVLSYNWGVFLVIGEGFMGLMAGVFIGVMVAGLDAAGAGAGAGFRVGARAANVILWCAVAALIFVIVDMSTVVVLYVRTDPAIETAATLLVERATLCNATATATASCLELASSTLAPLLAHALHHYHSFLLVGALVTLGAMGLLHVVTMIIYAPLMSAYARASRKQRHGGGSPSAVVVAPNQAPVSASGRDALFEANGMGSGSLVAPVAMSLTPPASPSVPQHPHHPQYHQNAAARTRPATAAGVPATTARASTRANTPTGGGVFGRRPQ